MKSITASKAYLERLEYEATMFYEYGGTTLLSEKQERKLRRLDALAGKEQS